MSRSSLKISHVETPSQIFCQEWGEKELQLTKLMDGLQKTYSRHKRREKIVPDVNDLCAVRHPTNYRWYRGCVTEVKENGIKMRFVDFGFSEWVTLNHVRSLKEQFRIQSPFSVLCHIEGVQPPGDVKIWSATACEFVRQIVKRQSDVFILQKGDVDPQMLSIPIQIFVNKLTPGEALGPSKKVVIDLSLSLVDNRLAVPLIRFGDSSKSADESFTAFIPEVVEEIIQSSGIDLAAVLNSLESSQTTDQPGICDNHEESEPTLISAGTDSSEDSKPTLEEHIVKWKKPRVPCIKEFQGMPTYVGDDGLIHLHEFDKGNKLLADIEAGLCEQFKSSRPQPQDLYWSIGQACIARFFLDGRWYRASVVKILRDKGKVQVLFIDYGNLEILSPKFLRKDIRFLDIPAQCLTCKLSNTRPRYGTWTQKTILYIDKCIIDRKVRVTITADPHPDKPLEVSITLNDDIDLGELLKCQGLAEEGSVPCCSDSFRVRDLFAEELEDSDDICVANKMLLPCVGQVIPVRVSYYVSPSELYLHLLPPINDPSSTSVVTNYYRRFLAMQGHIKHHASLWPCPQSPNKAQMYCGLYTQDGNWYRVVITDILAEGDPIVSFIDFGNTDVIKTSMLRELPVEFLNEPSFCVRCKLHQMQPGDGTWTSDDVEIIAESLEKYKEVLYARIKEVDPEVKVDIVFMTEGGVRLVYQDLIDVDLIKLVRGGYQ